MATTRRTRKTAAPSTDIVAEDLNLDTDVIIPADGDLPAVNVTRDVTMTDGVPKAAPTRKYFSHANCDHARSGEAGKKARAACRAQHRAYLAAEAEYLKTANVAV